MQQDWLYHLNQVKKSSLNFQTRQDKITSASMIIIPEYYYHPEYSTMGREIFSPTPSKPEAALTCSFMIKEFAGVAVNTNQRMNGYPCPPYKIIVLDEADSMTEDAQACLMRSMETHSKVTRFFFICNYISRIIEPLASRCAKFRFKPLTEEIMSNRILYICNEEGIHLDAEGLSFLRRT
ncbi:replication factor C subunit 4 [Trifolium repens]|nr:replication factor C subunit 4 [Trifolium repens]